MKAEIISIGDELLIGQTVNTNAAWMGQELSAIGLQVQKVSVISDEADAIKQCLDAALVNADIVLITGGLGPTNDDITKYTLSEYFGSELVFNEQVYKHIQELLSTRQSRENSKNKIQAEVPKACTVLMNTAGTAPGMWFEQNNKVVVSMPGVPQEMKTLMQEEVIPRLKLHFNFPVILHKNVLTFGGFEALLAEMLEEFEAELPENVKLAYLPSYGVVKLRLTVFANGEKEAQTTAEEQVRKLKKYIPQYIFGYDEEQLIAVIHKILLDKKVTIATAESCTGGNIAAQLTSQSGSSAYFIGAVIAYANKVKQQVLGVSEEDLDNHGAVSKQVVEQMALGVKELYKTDYTIATSGIAGPAGGTEKKPVGTIWIAIAGPKGVESQQFAFGSKRERNITRAVNTSFGMLREKLLEE